MDCSHAASTSTATSATEQTHEFKDSRLGRIPIEWDVRSMSELTTQIVDGVHHTPTYTSSGVSLHNLSLTSLLEVGSISTTRDLYLKPRIGSMRNEWSRDLPATYSYPRTAHSEYRREFRS